VATQYFEEILLALKKKQKRKCSLEYTDVLVEYEELAAVSRNVCRAAEVPVKGSLVSEWQPRCWAQSNHMHSSADGKTYCREFITVARCF